MMTPDIGNRIGNNMKRDMICKMAVIAMLLPLLAGNACAEDANSGIDARELADELTADGWVVYGTGQCYFCNEQKEEFGDAFANMTYVNCIEDRQACIDADVHGIPCWVSPNGTAYHGYHNLTRLSKLLNDYRAAHQTPSPATTAATTTPPNATGIDARELADELTDDGWVLYGTEQCPWCVRQEEEFVDAFGNLTYINCMENRSACIDAGIEGIPCWASPNGTLHPGYHNLTRLSGLVGDYRAAHPTPTPNPAQTPASAVGFESVSALIAMLVVFLIKRM